LPLLCPHHPSAACCRLQDHFDLSYDAFTTLAHPVYGVMSLEVG